MTAKIIDGKATAAEVRQKVAEDVAEMVAAGKPKPGLATVLVGEDPASQVYVRSKIRACEKAGIESFGFNLPATASQEEVERLVKELNADPKVNGILVQLPLPDGLDEEKVLQAINLEKDVDGFHPINIGRLAQKGRESLFVPCTPSGIMYLLGQTGVPLAGAEAVVLGRSNIVGMASDQHFFRCIGLEEFRKISKVLSQIIRREKIGTVEFAPQGDFSRLHDLHLCRQRCCVGSDVRLGRLNRFRCLNFSHSFDGFVRAEVLDFAYIPVGRNGRPDGKGDQAGNQDFHRGIRLGDQY